MHQEETTVAGVYYRVGLERSATQLVVSSSSFYPKRQQEIPR